MSKQFKKKPSLIERAWAQVEGAKFGFKLGKKLVEGNPFMPHSELMVRVTVAWADHLTKTNRSHLVLKPDVIKKYKNQLVAKDIAAAIHAEQAFVAPGSQALN